MKFANNSVQFENLDICILTTFSMTKNVHSLVSVLSLSLWFGIRIANNSYI